MKAKRKYPSGMDSIEKRAFHCNLEIRGSDQGTTIEGYAAVFDSLSEDLGGFREIIVGGSFKRTLKAGADVRALVDHDPSKILGRNKAGTLTLREDDHGLKVRIKPPDTTAGRDVVESLRRGDLDQMSFAFSVVSDSWQTIDGEEVRTITDVDLHDVSVVAYGSYTDTTVAVRSLDRARSDNNLRAAIFSQGAIVDAIKRRA